MEKWKVQQNKGEWKCQVKGGSRRAIFNRVVRVDFIEMTFLQVPKEGEGVRHGPDYEKVAKHCP